MFCAIGAYPEVNVADMEKEMVARRDSVLSLITGARMSPDSIL